MGALNKKSGLETFAPAGFQLQEFWQWAGSDLLSNTQRGILAEYLVAKAVGSAGGVRTEWDAVDVVTPSDIRVEVKSAAYVQSWTQDKLSSITFNIAPRKSWDAQTNEYEGVAGRSADVYVFALLAEKNRDVVNPMDLSQWVFYVISTTRLDEAVSDQKTISLRPLLKLNPRDTNFDGLNAAIVSEAKV
ncbi:MAG: hypothetical protein GY903_05410 [Fuerstiella sp.]|nr:hypothetical protein [Fuerstiella sp.]MCP4853912.1 hypothetical protein [Fuerstiella sp.]